MFLRKGNTFPSVPLVHTANMKESIENMKLLVENIQYEKYNQNICGELKATRSFVAFCVSGTVGTENVITSTNSGLKENRLFEDRRM